jgi:hypothetical protein
MRAATLSSVLVVAIACGSSSDRSQGGTGGGGSAQFALHLATTGDGLIRGAGSDCRGACTAQLAAGSQVQLQAVPDAGATFMGWSGACGGTGPCQVTLNADASVSATFARQAPPPGSHRLTVIVEGKGRVVSSPSGIDCDSSTCSADFADGTAVSLAPTAASGFSFAGWGGACSGPGACSMPLRADAQVFAHFDPAGPQQSHLIVSSTGPGKVSGGGIDCGNGAGTCDVTFPAGSPTVMLTATPAADARFLGWGGACSGTAATCSITVQGETRVTASFGAEVQTLFANDGSTNAGTTANALAINSTDVFFVRFLSDGGSTWAVPKSGGAARRVTSTAGFQMVADDAFLYFVSGSVGGQIIVSVPVGGGAPSTIFSAAGHSIGKLALDSGALYFPVTQNLTEPGSIHRMENRVDRVIASGQPANAGLAVDSGSVYFTFVSPNDRDESGIKRVDKSGGPVTTLVTADEVPITVRADSRNVYYRDDNGVIFAVNKDGSGRHVVSGNPGRAFLVDFDVNAFVVWWMWTGPGPGPQGLFRANADGSGFAAVDTSSDQRLIGPRVDDTAVYYWQDDTLLKRLK